MSDPKPRKPTPLVARLLGVCAGCLVLATLAGRLGRFWPLADLCSHFVIYYVTASAVVLVSAVVLRRRRIAGVALALVLIHGWSVLPLYMPRQDTTPTDGPVLRLALVNLLHKNRDHERALDFIRRCGADIVFLQEIDPWWERTVRGSDVPYRFVVARPAEGSFGIAMLTHTALDERGEITVEDTRVLEFADGHPGAERPGIEATLRFAGRRVKLLSIHPPPPTTSALSRMRDAILRKAKAWADEQTDPHVIIGDLNTTPWSHAFDLLAGDGRLISTQLGRGNQGTFPTHLPMPWLLPIDHCLVSPAWVCVGREIGSETGSDHLPLLVSLALGPGGRSDPQRPGVTDGPAVDAGDRAEEEPRPQPATIGR